MLMDVPQCIISSTSRITRPIYNEQRRYHDALVLSGGDARGSRHDRKSIFTYQLSPTASSRIRITYYLLYTRYETSHCAITNTAFVLTVHKLNCALKQI